MTVYKRDDRWVVKVWADGRYRWLGTFATKKEARAAEQSHMPARGGSLTVDEFAAVWLKDYKRPSTSTNRNNRYALNGFRKEFGRRRLASLERPEAGRWARKVPYSQYRAVRTMFADALRDGLVPQNPFAQLRIPVPERRRHLDVLTESEVCELADGALKIYDEHLAPTVRALVLVAGFAGLRPAELAALDWGDVDLTRGLLHVREAIGGEGETKDPKTWAGRRICVLPPPARDALAALDRHEGERAVFVTPRPTVQEGGLASLLRPGAVAVRSSRSHALRLAPCLRDVAPRARPIARGRRGAARPQGRRWAGSPALRPPRRAAPARQNRPRIRRGFPGTGRKLVAEGWLIVPDSPL
jgi:integrase